MTPIAPGETVLHFNPTSGRIVRVVRVVRIDHAGTATVERTNGPRKGELYQVGIGVLIRSNNNPR